jgi:hypothetical protein
MTMSSDAAQVGALVRLRWRMIRSRPKQVGLAVTVLAVLLGVGVMLAVARQAVPVELRDQALIAYPTFLLVVFLVSVLSPFLAGGATELYPASHLVAYPVRARTRFAVSLLLMPLNLAWSSQIVVLAFLVVVGSIRAPWLPQLAVVTIGFVLAATVLGQALAWAGAGIRQTRRGRTLTNVAGALLALVIAVLAWRGLIVELADRSPLVEVLGSGLDPWGPRSLGTTAGFVGLALVSFVLGTWAVSWTVRRRSEISGLNEGAAARPRDDPRSSTAALAQINRAAVWRSTPLRRGSLLLVAMPIATAALFTLEWQQLVLLPGLVAAGAALLFGVNAFSLYGSGALWLAAQPMLDHTLLRAQARIIAEFVGLATVVAALGTALLARERPTVVDAIVLICAALASSTWVFAACLSYSVRHPHQADLRGTRDTPAPPGSMTGYSLRLAVAVSAISLLMTAAVSAQSALLAVGVLLAVVTLALGRAARVARQWAAPEVRSRVLVTVAAG